MGMGRSAVGRLLRRLLSPYPVYPSAAFWLTDYVISQDLQAAYAAQQEGGENDGGPQAGDGGSPAMTPEIKQQIADEVKNQLALENSEGQQSAQRTGRRSRLQRDCAHHWQT